ncbi:MAG: hypothetical protein MMC33_008857 [Icmadophila ericetorum]|nr:hypothetical protein [Icmadophila ericetorum]
MSTGKADINPALIFWITPPKNRRNMGGTRNFDAIRVPSAVLMGEPTVNGSSRIPAFSAESLLTGWNLCGIWITDTIRMEPVRNAMLEEKELVRMVETWRENSLGTLGAYTTEPMYTLFHIKRHVNTASIFVSFRLRAKFHKMEPLARAPEITRSVTIVADDQLYWVPASSRAATKRTEAPNRRIAPKKPILTKEIRKEACLIGELVDGHG